MGGLTAAEKRRLDVLEHSVGILVGFALGGPAGARLGNAAVNVHQASPLVQAQKELLFSTLPDRTIQQSIQAPEYLGNFPLPPPLASKKKRRASAYSKRYGKAFKLLAPKYKLKSGSWKKNGFKLCAAAARRKAKK
jgi:hypothetical protein